MESSADRTARFVEIYARKRWGRGSGPGSEPRKALPFLDRLRATVAALRPAGILDVGCGQGLALHALQGWAGRYLGLDLAPSVIARAARDLAGTGREFLVHDIVEAPPPGRWDLVVCKDVLQHLSRDSVRRALAYIAPAAAGPVLLVNDSRCGRGIDGEDARDGGYRPIRREEIASAWPGFVLHLADYPVHTVGNVPDTKSIFLLS